MALCLGTTGLQGQEINASAENYKDMMRKNLVVEMPDTVPPTGRKALVYNYPQQNYGLLLKRAVENHWKLNSKIEFAEPQEVKKSLEKFDARSVFMYIKKHPDSPDDQNIWVLHYTRVSRTSEKIDYSIFLPVISNRTVEEYYQFDFDFIINLMQENIKYNQKNDVKLNAGEYAFIEAKANCAKLEKRNIMYDSKMMAKEVDEKTARRAFRRQAYTPTTAENIANHWEDFNDSAAILTVYPKGFVSYSTSAFKEQYPVYIRMIYSASDFRVLAAVGSHRKDNILLETVGDDIEKLMICEKKK